MNVVKKPDRRWFLSAVLLVVGLGALPVMATPGSGDSNVFALNTRAVSAVESERPPLAGPFVGPCAPNPFNPQTVIPFGLAARGPARLVVFDVRGRVVRVLLDELDLAPGARRATWDGRDDDGRDAASGVYLAKLQSGAQVLTTTLVLVR